MKVGQQSEAIQYYEEREDELNGALKKKEGEVRSLQDSLDSVRSEITSMQGVISEKQREMESQYTENLERLQKDYKEKDESQ
jgi:prefoldin subunit 5